MTISSLLAELREAGIQLWLEGGVLKYRAEKGVLTPERRETLQARKLEIISFLGKLTANKDAPILASSSDSIPLSYAQQRLWFLRQYNPRDPSYHIPIAQHLVGPLNVQALQLALKKLLARHPSLRMAFFQTGSETNQAPVQIDEWELPIISVTKGEVDRYRMDFALEPFDLVSGGLFRVLLLALAPREHVLLITMHHIISDGWSTGLVAKELSHLYNRALSGDESTLSELTIQYTDYALWQAECLQNNTHFEQLTFWQQ